MSAVYMSPPSVEVLLVPGANIVEHWDNYKPLITEALAYEHEGVDTIDIFNKVRAGTWLCLVIEVNGEMQGLCMCEQIKARKGWSLDLIMLAGMNLHLWIDRLFAVVCKVAAEHNCNAIRIQGRMGWLRMLKRFGFKPISQHLRLELES